MCVPISHVRPCRQVDRRLAELDAEDAAKEAAKQEATKRREERAARKAEQAQRDREMLRRIELQEAERQSALQSFQPQATFQPQGTFHSAGDGFGVGGPSALDLAGGSSKEFGILLDSDSD